MAGRTILLIPIYNDWVSVQQLVLQMEALKIPDLHILLVNDSSTDPAPALSAGNIPVEILHLALQLGHQKAIAVGLAYIHQNLPCERVLVMDGDGEDRPEDAGLLLHKAKQFPGNILVAKRVRREDGFFFKLFYPFNFIL